MSCLHRDVRIGVLSVATLSSATPRLMGATLSEATGRATEHREVVADTLELGQASVTAARASLAPGVTARQVTTLTRDELAAGVNSLNDLLKLSAAIDVRQRGGFGIQTDISIDGGTHDQMALLLNGVSLVNPQTGHNAADFPFNLSDIARVEIIEGAASRVMGSQAFSGAINIVTRSSASDNSPLEARLEAGSYGTFRAEARTVWNVGKAWHISASGSAARSDGAVVNSDFKLGKGYGRIMYAGKDVKLDFQLGATSTDFGANTFYSAAYPNQWEATKRYVLSARAETAGRVHLTAQTSWLRNVDHFQLTRHSTAGENFNRCDVFTLNLGGWTDWRLGRTAIGTELREEYLLSNNLGDSLAKNQYVAIPHTSGRYYVRNARRTNLSYFLEHNFRLGSFATLSAGVMAERNNAIDSKFRFYPGADLSLLISPQVRFFASWNKSLRLPSFTDLWYKSATQEGNVGLKPEECWAARLGADYSLRGVNLSAKVHYQRGTHMIDWVMYSAEDIYHATSFSLDNYGAGADVRFNFSELLGKRQPLELFSISYAWTGQHRRAGADYFKSNYALEYLRHKLTAHLRHRIAWKLAADWNFRLQKREGAYLIYKDLKPTAELRPYGTHALLDLRLTWAERHWSLYADFTNLTNHHYYDLGNVRQAGLVVIAGVSVKI